MDVRLLGPVEASVEGQPVPLGGTKARAVLAMLALDAAATVSTDRLIEGLWGERPPATAAKTLQVYVSRLRRALATNGDGADIVTRARGYELRLAPDHVDVCRFERLLESGAPRDALALWRGPPLDDVADEPFAAGEIRRLEELRLAALERAVDADLAAGRHLELVGELESLVAEHPLHERLHWQLMLALYRSRPAGRCAGCLPPGAGAAGRADRPGARARAAAAARRDPAPRPLAHGRGGRSRAAAGARAGAPRCGRVPVQGACLL
jgi:DNA-binding SARP family transcriptional activator